MTSAPAEALSTPEPTTHAGDGRQFLTFTVDESVYGIDIVQVREIKGWSETTRLPNTEPYFLGVMNLRGTIVPVFDLRCRFTGALTDTTPKHVVIIMVLHGKQVGILVDAVSDIIDAVDSDIGPVPEQESAEAGTCLHGILTANERMVMLLDAERLLHHALQHLESQPSTSHSATH